MVLIGLIGLCLLVALADMAVTEPGMRDWYPSLRHPVGTPPGWLFPVVWTPIYVVMAVAAWRIWRWNPLDRLRETGSVAPGRGAPGQMPRQIPGQAPGHAPGQMLERMLRRVSARMPGRGPGRGTGRAPAGLALRRRGLQLWGWQLCANALWTPFFFGLHRPLAALAVLAALALLVGLTLRDFRRLDRPAGLMMAPYLAWVCYALWLNAGIAWLNPA